MFKQRSTEWREQERRYELKEYQQWDEESDWEEEQEEDGVRVVEQSRIVDLWSRIERNRRQIAEQEARFQRWLQWSPELRKHWQQFIDAGGVTANDFDKFCAGKMRHRSTREKKHLRLVSKKNSPTIRRSRFNSGNDAA